MSATHSSIRRARPLLGTFVEIAVVGGDAEEAAVEAAFLAVAEVHRLMSFHDAGSDVSRLNQGAASSMVRVHDWTYYVLEAARDLYHRSGGMFDISVAPALQRLGLLPSAPALSSPSDSPVIAHESGQSSDPRQPVINASLGVTGCPAFDRSRPWPTSAATKREKSETSDFAGHDTKNEMNCQNRRTGSSRDTIHLLPDNRVRFADPSVKIDLGGIAKGFAVDRAVEALHRHGIAEGLVNAGGDLRAFGPRSHLVDVRHPCQPDRPFYRVALWNSSLASSAGRFDPLCSHNALDSSVIDPATAMPVRSISGATVCAPGCMIADALTKVVMNAGEAAAPVLEHHGADALFVSAHGDVHITADWKNEVHLAA
jgi:thiamine biosynthesis lipoprotein ApbE